MIEFLPSLHSFLIATTLAATSNAASVAIVDRPVDPCVKVGGGQEWVSPQDLKACFKGYKVDPDVKANIIEVINKTLAFHTSTNYEALAPAPFSLDVHEDVPRDLARIARQNYASDYDLHVDISNSVKRLQDGHCVWINYCYVPLFVNYLPTPLSLITDRDGRQRVHIAYEAFQVVSAEFPDQIDFWQNSLPGKLKGQLSTLSGATVLSIDGKDPFAAVDANAKITGGYQGFGTRQNSFFSSYQIDPYGWSYNFGDFAQQSLPLSDSVTLSILRVNHTLPEVVTIPYRSRIYNAWDFANTAEWREKNCLANYGTNGYDIYDDATPASKRVKQPLMDKTIDLFPKSNAALPPALVPPAPLSGYSVTQFHLLSDNKTGVLALGLFQDPYTSLYSFLRTLAVGLQQLKDAGAEKLIIDLSNNGGGYICAAHWLHRVIIGPKATTEPQAGLDTKARAGPLARLITKTIAEKDADPWGALLYNPLNWFAANNSEFPPRYDWLNPPVPTIVNGRADAFSQRLGSDCPAEAYGIIPPDEALFDPKNIVLVSNGRCASSCSLFSISMSKKDHVKTVVIGGKQDVPQQYCGIVGGQSTDFWQIDTDIKSTKLKNHSLAPPDLLVNAVQGITWRLAYGVWNTEEPEEWQNHPADINLPITAEISNNPIKIWETVAKRVFH